MIPQSTDHKLRRVEWQETQRDKLLILQPLLKLKYILWRRNAETTSDERDSHLLVCVANLSHTSRNKAGTLECGLL